MPEGIFKQRRTTFVFMVADELADDRGSRLARIGRSTCDGPDVAAFRSSFHAEIASTNDWSRLA
jgi:hypothetical protein